MRYDVHTVGVTLLAAGLAMVVSGCRATPPSMPPTPGYVSLERRDLRRPDFTVGGLGAYPLDEIAGRIAVEPYLTPRLSLPIEGRSGWPGNLQLRVGPRFRTNDWFAVGFGAGMTLYRLDDREVAAGYGHFDGEMIMGWRWHRFGLSVGLRPMIGGGGEFDGEARSGLLTVLGDLSVAVFLSRTSALTFHAGGYGFAWLTEPTRWWGSAFWGIGFAYNPR